MNMFVRPITVVDYGEIIGGLAQGAAGIQTLATGTGTPAQMTCPVIFGPRKT